MMIKHYILQALDSNGKSVFIDDVPRGKKCGCFCSECKGALIARHGNVKAHHFAHESGNDSIKCSQTALHLLAKEIITEEKRIPAFVNGTIDFINVEKLEQEKNLGDIKPDLYTEINGKPIAVEIYVSHPVDDAKFLKIQNHKLTTFEINLSELIFETKDEVKKAIYDLLNIRPIYDEIFTEKILEDKKKFIDTNGINKNIINGIVYECPMNLGIRNMKAEMEKVKSSICEKCPFGYKLQNENIVHCIGHLNINLSQNILLSKIKQEKITVNLDYGCRVSVTQNKVVSLAEVANYFTSVTGIKFTEDKRKPKKRQK